MRVRTSLLTALLPCCVLGACSAAPAALPPAEVLKRAIISTMTLENAKVEATVNFSRKEKPLTALLALTGSLSPLKHRWIMDIGGTFTIAKSSAFALKAKIASPEPGVVFVNLSDVHSTDPRMLAALSGSALRGWRSVGSSSGAAVSGSASPDPALIDAYASAIDVESGGLERDAQGGYRYRYTVGIDPKVLSGLGEDGSVPAIRGDLTIDAKSFLLQSVRWTVRGLPTQIGAADVVIDARFSDQNASPVRLPDVMETSPFPDGIFDMISAR